MRTRPGFSFTEVLFAVMILGVGFIMIAAIFPVSLAQTKANDEETSAAMITRGAVSVIEQVATDSNLPVAANVVPLPPLVRNAVGSDAICNADPRRGFVGFYRRADGWSYAQLFLVPMQIRNRSVYTSGEDVGGAVNSSFVYRTVTADTFTASTQLLKVGGGATDRASIAIGTYMIVQGGALAGRVYRVGAPGPAVDEWYLAPGADFQREPGSDGILNNGDDVSTLPGGSSLLLIGRGPVNGTGAEGASQDIAVYTTFINLR